MSNKTVSRETTTIKNYSYEFNGVKLSFSLKMDNSSNIKSFLLLLKTAQQELEEDIKQFE